MKQHLLALLVSLAAGGLTAVPAAAAVSSVDLSQYRLTGRFDLPNGSGGNLLAQEASTVTWNRDTGSLFVLGDGGTAIVQVSLSGELIDSMSLAPGLFADPEGLAYIGGGQFVAADERVRAVGRFSYTANQMLTAGGVQSVKLGTTVGNVGIEGIGNDPLTGGYIVVKEKSPLGIFQTMIDFDAGTASNGSPSTVNSVNLFDPALAGVADFADVFALSNLGSLQSAAEQSHLLVLSEESGRIVEIGRDGTFFGSLDVGIPAQNEGLTMDDDGVLYVVNELGGGSVDRPQLWVYAPTAAVPEPASVALMAVGVLAILGRRRGAMPS